MIYALFPILAAMCYASAYIFGEKVLQKTNMASMLLLTAPLGFLTWLAAIWFLNKYQNQSLNFSSFNNKQTLFFAVAISVLGTLGYIFTLFSLQKVSATYTATAEVSYPLFTILFLWLFFGEKQFDLSILCGGLLVLLGSFTLIYGQIKITK